LHCGHLGAFGQGTGGEREAEKGRYHEGIDPTWPS